MSLARLSESLQDDTTRLLQPGNGRTTNGKVVRVRVEFAEEFQPVIPVVLPDLQELREFATKIHMRKTDWHGEAFGWDAEYHASHSAPPDDSQMHFTPATFWIGDATIWGFSLMWEDGDEKPPVETLNDWNIVGEL